MITVRQTKCFAVANGHCHMIALAFFNTLVKAGFQWNEAHGMKFIYLTRVLNPNDIPTCR